MLADWRFLPDGKEKREAYYLSPEWSMMRTLVRGRSGGWCEWCRQRWWPRWRYARDCHHLNYDRLYCELPSDIVHLCRQCHIEAHRKRSRMQPRWFKFLLFFLFFCALLLSAAAGLSVLFGK